MKKIYMILAAIALLSMSLNAQMMTTKKALVQPNTSTEKVDTPPDGYFRMGPSRASTTPVTPPYSNDFGSNALWNWWEVINANNDGTNYTWALSSNTARYRWNSSRAADDWLVTAPITLEAGKTYKFYLDTWAQTTSYPERLEVKMASTNTATALSNGTTIIGQTTVTALSSSPQHLSNENVTVSTSGNYYIGIHAISDADMYYLYVDNFVIDVAAAVHDLSIALSATPTVAAGGSTTLTATVTNIGNFAESGYTVTFYANGTAIDTQTGESLAIGASQNFTATYTTTDAQGGTTVNFTAVVSCNGDEVVANNEAAASTSVITLPPPENVAATTDLTNATVTWDAPSNLPSETTTVTEYVTEGFDDTSVFEPFSLGGITAENHIGANGGWTLYDPTGATVWGVENGDFPNMSSPHAWFVMNPSQATGISITPNSPEQYMESICPLNNSSYTGGAADHWLISPELSGNAQTISFYERVITTQYGNETYEILVSSNDINSLDPSSGFTVLETVNSSAMTWTLRSFELPAGTKYFAIRHTSNDIFGMMVDDVRYQVANTSTVTLAPTSYNVYLDGTLVGSVNANDPLTYDINNLADGEYTVEISAVYSLGESAKAPVTFTIDSTNPTIEISPETQTIDDNAAGSLTVTGTDIEGNISVSAANDWSLNPTSLSNTGGDVNVTYTGRDLSATTTVTASATGATDATATVNYVADLYIVGNFGNGWDFNNGTHMTYANGIYTATLTANANSYILFARLLGNSNPWGTRDVFGPVSDNDWWMTGDSNGGNLNLYDSKCIYFQDGGTYRITIDANAGTFTITKLNGEQTATPVITSSSDGEYVTITATGDGTVTLNVPGYDPVSGEGSASITIPCGYASNTITVTATAKEDGKDESDPASAQITIPAGSGWTEMDGTYGTNDLLSFTKDGEDIMMVDQFLASTLNNDHPDHYTYTLRQTVNGETQTSSPVDIPVYKTNATMQGFYTQTQVEEDIDMKLKAQVLNSKMNYEVNPDHNVLYYSLYRGDLNADYPVIDVQHRISQLQKFEDNTSGSVQYFMFENHTSGVTPRYDHLGNEIAERLDTNYVQGAYQDEISYVPVIWTFGLYSGREDGKNNSYGSDIKHEILGGVNAEILGQKSDYSDYGKWTADGVEYCVYTPVIRITGVPPMTKTDGDGHVSTYVPYMYRAWCTYEGARDFKHNSDGQLIDNGPMTTPFLLGTDTQGENVGIIGSDWQPGDGRLEWAFGVPVDEDATNVTFVIRFYYKKVVTEAQQEGENNTFKLGNGENEEYYVVETEGDATSIVTAINELFNGRVPVSTTYVNTQGMQSDKPFDGINIVITRYSDGTTRTTKVVR